MFNLTFDKILLLVDKTVYSLYGDKILAGLKKSKKGIVISSVPSGEESKNLEHIPESVKPFFKERFSRNSILVSVGGGVLSDLGGFLSSILLRGLRSIYIPTTLLSQIDASIGGKTGVNFNLSPKIMYKNMFGTFYQPNLVVTDINFLRTLPSKEIINGLGEMVKYSIGWGKPTLKELILIKNLRVANPDKVLPIISKCQKIKIEIIKKDPMDTMQIREKLNLGHTLGHALEGVKSSNISHGEAVSIGIIFAAKLSTRIGMLDKTILDLIVNSIKSLDLPVKIPDVSIPELIQIMESDKKNGNFVLIRDVGKLQTGIRIKKEVIKKVLTEEMI